MSRELVKPIHTGAVGLSNLRFFASHLEGPRMPWHSVDDLHRCLTMDRSHRRFYLSRLKREQAKDIRHVRTEKGVEIIAPHFMAQGLICAMIEMGFAPASFEYSYAAAGVGAIKALTVGLDSEATVAWSMAAYRNEETQP